MFQRLYIELKFPDAFQNAVSSRCERTYKTFALLRFILFRGKHSSGQWCTSGPRPTYILAPCKPVSPPNNHGFQPCSKVWFRRRGPAQSKYNKVTPPPKNKPQTKQHSIQIGQKNHFAWVCEWVCEVWSQHWLYLALRYDARFLSARAKCQNLAKNGLEIASL